MPVICTSHPSASRNQQETQAGERKEQGDNAAPFYQSCRRGGNARLAGVAWQGRESATSLFTSVRAGEEWRCRRRRGGGRRGQGIRWGEGGASGWALGGLLSSWVPLYVLFYAFFASPLSCPALLCPVVSYPLCCRFRLHAVAAPRHSRTVLPNISKFSYLTKLSWEFVQYFQD